LIELGRLYERQTTIGYSGDAITQALEAYHEAIELLEPLGAMYDYSLAKKAHSIVSSLAQLQKEDSTGTSAMFFSSDYRKEPMQALLMT
jgi:hypothetical protein